MRRLLGPVATAAMLLMSVGSAYAVTIYLNGSFVGVSCGSLSSSSIVPSSSLCRAAERSLSLSAASSSVIVVPPPVLPPPPPQPDPALVEILQGIDDVVLSTTDGELTSRVITVSSRIWVYGSASIAAVDDRLDDNGFPTLDDVLACFLTGVLAGRQEGELCVQTEIVRSVKKFAMDCNPSNLICIGIRVAVAPGPHQYSTSDNVICDTNVVPAEFCNVETVFNVATSQNELAVPMVRSPKFVPVSSGAPVTLYPVEPIRIFKNTPRPFCYTAVTDPQHLFHPGQVERCIRQIGTTVVAETNGTGTGCFAQLNNISGKAVYEVVNDKLRAAFAELVEIVLIGPIGPFPQPPNSSF
jgi:hypothetical protein